MALPDNPKLHEVLAVEEILGGSGDWAQFAGNVENVGVGGAAGAGGDALLCYSDVGKLWRMGSVSGFRNFNCGTFLLQVGRQLQLTIQRDTESRLDRGHLNPSERHRNAMYHKRPNHVTLLLHQQFLRFPFILPTCF